MQAAEIPPKKKPTGAKKDACPIFEKLAECPYGSKLKDCPKLSKMKSCPPLVNGCPFFGKVS